MNDNDKYKDFVQLCYGYAQMWLLYKGSTDSYRSMCLIPKV